MQNQTDKPLKPDAASADQSKYLIHSRLEIATILRTLGKAGSMVTAYFGGGNDFILTSIVAVKPEQNVVYADYGADVDANQRALKARKITFVAAHERIKIQFVAESLRNARLGGRDVFSMEIPPTLLRLQRREYFRIATPLTKPLVCIIAPQPGPVQAPAQITIVDISCGGIAVIDSSAPTGIEAGICLRGCRIVLPELGEVTTDIMVRSTFEVTFRSGAKHKRAGCEFVDMRERDRALIQRYISRLERERKDRAGAR
jgi:c-di-GMP-binding flagellar brake protein YcgR